MCRLEGLTSPLNLNLANFHTVEMFLVTFAPKQATTFILGEKYDDSKKRFVSISLPDFLTQAQNPR